MSGYYQRDLACVHHEGFGDFSRRSAPALLKLLRSAGIHHGLVVDLGCGSGTWARALLQNGYEVLGIDRSPTMLSLARKTAPSGKFRKQSLWRASIPPCFAVTALGEALNYHPGAPDLKKLFARVHEALRPGGLFIFDFLSPGSVPNGHAVSHRRGRNWDVFVEATENVRKREVQRRIILFRKVGKSYRRSDEFHRVRVYRHPEIPSLLTGLGFRVRVLLGYGKVRFRKGQIGVLAKKKKGDLR